MRARTHAKGAKRRLLRLALIAGALGATLFATAPSNAEVCHQVGFHPQWAPNFDYESPEICHWGASDLAELVRDILGDGP